MDAKRTEGSPLSTLRYDEGGDPSTTLHDSFPQRRRWRLAWSPSPFRGGFYPSFFFR